MNEKMIAGSCPVAKFTFLSDKNSVLQSIARGVTKQQWIDCEIPENGGCVIL